MTNAHLEAIGQLADKADNYIAASQLPLPAMIHLEQLRIGLQQISDGLKAVVREVSGEDPWAEPGEDDPWCTYCGDPVPPGRTYCSATCRAEVEADE